jgi:polyhydroxyalkanoate synthesis regulator phasin
LEAVRDGKADVRIAHAIAALVGQVLRATEQEELRHEVEELTAQVAELREARKGRVA